MELTKTLTHPRAPRNTGVRGTTGREQRRPSLRPFGKTPPTLPHGRSGSKTPPGSFCRARTEADCGTKNLLHTRRGHSRNSSDNNKAGEIVNATNHARVEERPHAPKPPVAPVQHEDRASPHLRDGPSSHDRRPRRLRWKMLTDDTARHHHGSRASSDSRLKSFPTPKHRPRGGTRYHPGDRRLTGVARRLDGRARHDPRDPCLTRTKPRMTHRVRSRVLMLLRA